MTFAPSPDSELDAVEDFFAANSDFIPLVRASLREGIDDVIDGRRTRRFAYDQLNTSEKSFCGIRIESALVRNLELPFGQVLDISVNGIDVDVKVSSSGNWMIGPRQVGLPLLVVSFSEAKERFSVGVVRAAHGSLNPGKNRDAKRSFSKGGKSQIRWLARDAPLPVSIFAGLPPGAFERIVAQRSRGARLKLFLSLIPAYVPFPRAAIETVVGGDDPLRGTRQDRSRGGHHPLGAVRVLSYQRNAVVESLGLPRLAQGEHMKVRASDVQPYGVS